jgi:nucleotide-binding universal stress UspA family protein
MNEKGPIRQSRSYERKKEYSVMFQRIFVPLDGSARAEHAIPVAARLARSSQGTVVLGHIVHPPSEVGDYGAEPEAMAVPPTSHEKHLTGAEHYLQHVLDTYGQQLTGVRVEQEVETGATVDTIFSIARLEHIDLIVICSHGAHPLLHWVFRSIAREAVHHSPVPVLVLKEHGGLFLEAPDARRLRMLVPLDGSSLAEAALEPALQLLTALATPDSAEMHLVRVVALPSIEDKPLLRAYEIKSEQERAVKEAEDYLQQVVRGFAQSIPVAVRPTITRSLAVSNHVGSTLAGMSESLETGQQGHSYDLIAMATHGRTGLQLLRLGSVTEHLLGATELPLLVVRPSQSAGRDQGKGEVGAAAEAGSR